MKILNLYAGIGGNRKLWTDVDVTAVEIKEDVASIYKKLYPTDNVVIADAHKYLLDHFEDGFDFIWCSPPCQSHSNTNHFLYGQGVRRYPDIKLYEEILFLKHWYKGKWVVENVKPYYEPLIKPYICGRHCFWSNFVISDLPINYANFGTWNRNRRESTQRKAIIREAQIPELIGLLGIDLKDIRLKNKRQILRNAVLPELGKHVFDCAFRVKQKTFEVIS